jgi:hypothetical protein
VRGFLQVLSCTSDDKKHGRRQRVLRKDGIVRLGGSHYVVQVHSLFIKDDIIISNSVNLCRPNTKWKLLFVTNLTVLVYRLSDQFPVMGGSAELPQYIIQHKALKPLHKNRKGEPYQDMKCFFRGLAYHFKVSKRVKKETSKLVEQFRLYADLPLPYDGGMVEENLLQVEKCFRIRVNLFELVSADETVDLRNLSAKNMSANMLRTSALTEKEAPNGTINFDLCNDHLSVIVDLNQYARAWNCTHCSTAFKNKQSCQRHRKGCVKNSNSRAKYIGGAYGLPKSLWDRCEEFGLEVQDSFRYCEYHTSFDFECISPELPEDDPRRGAADGKLKFERHLELVSCSVHCNYPGFGEPVHLRRNTTEMDLIKRLLDFFEVIADEHERLMREKLMPLSSQIQSRLAEYGTTIDDENQDRHVLGHCHMMKKQFEKLLADLEDYITIPVLYAFNGKTLAQSTLLQTTIFSGSRFDFKVAKRFIVPETMDRAQEIKVVLKRMGGYQSFKTERYWMKDAAALMPQVK